MYFAVDLLTTVNLDFQSEYILLAMIYDKEVYIICDITVNDKLITKTPFLPLMKNSIVQLVSTCTWHLFNV